MHKRFQSEWSFKEGPRSPLRCSSFPCYSRQREASQYPARQWERGFPRRARPRSMRSALPWIILSGWHAEREVVRPDEEFGRHCCEWGVRPLISHQFSCRESLNPVQRVVSNFSSPGAGINTWGSTLAASGARCKSVLAAKKDGAVGERKAPADLHVSVLPAEVLEAFSGIKVALHDPQSVAL